MEALAPGFGKAAAMFWIEMLRSWHPSWYIQRPEKHGTQAMLKSYPPTPLQKSTWLAGKSPSSLGNTSSNG